MRFFILDISDQLCIKIVIIRPQTIVPEGSDARLYEDPQISLGLRISEDLTSDKHRARGQTRPKYENDHWARGNPRKPLETLGNPRKPSEVAQASTMVNISQYQTLVSEDNDCSEAVRGCTRLYEAVQGSTRLYEAVRGSTRQQQAVRGSTRQQQAVLGSTRQ